MLPNPRVAVASIQFAARLLGSESAQAGADFIGGQANAEADELSAEQVDGAFAERARAMQHWLESREEERRVMGVAHVYERPRAIVDHDGYPRNGHSSRIRSKSSGKGHDRRSHQEMAKRSARGHAAGDQRHQAVRGAERRSAKASSKTSAGKSAGKPTASRSPGKSAKTSARKHR
ncbi:MAG: hypothetical protein FIA97_12515 [Methylococcaceae bacterium]|nr:hypothetical protein [Methylococcaceae bacterium]